MMTIDALTLPHMAHGTGHCTADYVNVREDASLTSAVLGKLRAGQPVTVWQVGGEWLRVQTDEGLTGWAAARYIALDGALVA